MEKHTDQKQVYFTIYIHWYHKQHYGHMIGCFGSLEKAIESLKIDKPKHFLLNTNHTFYVTYECCTPQSWEDLQLGIYFVYPEKVAKNSESITVELNASFPVWVYSQKYDQGYCKKLEKEIRESVHLKVKSSNPGLREPKIESSQMQFSTGSKNIKKISKQFVMSIS